MHPEDGAARAISTSRRDIFRRFSRTPESSQAAVAARIEELLGTAITRSLDRLASCRLTSPTLAAHDDEEPPDRQGTETRASGDAGQFAARHGLGARIDVLTIDVPGPVPITPGVFVGDSRGDGQTGAGRTGRQWCSSKTGAGR